jgi:hypothetical protein
MLQFLQDADRPSDREDRQRVFATTGYWPRLVEGYFEKAKEVTPSEARQLLFNGWPELMRVIDVMVQVGSPAEADDIAELAELDLKCCGRSLLLAERMGLVVREAHGTWSAERSLVQLATEGIIRFG